MAIEELGDVTEYRLVRHSRSPCTDLGLQGKGPGNPDLPITRPVIRTQRLLPLLHSKHRAAIVYWHIVEIFSHRTARRPESRAQSARADPRYERHRHHRLSAKW